MRNEQGNSGAFSRNVFTGTISAKGGDRSQAIAILESRGLSKEAKVVLAMGVDPMSLDGPGSPLLRDFAQSYFEPLRKFDLLSLIAGWRRVEAYTHAVANNSPVSAGWAAEMRPLVATRSSFSKDTVGMKQVGAISVITKELDYLSRPNAAQAAFLDNVKGVASETNATLLALDNGGSSARPKSLTHDAQKFPVAGNSVDQIEDACEAAQGNMISGGSTGMSTVAIAHPRIWLAKSRQRTNGVLAFPGLTARGGTFMGCPAFASPDAPADLSQESGMSGSGAIVFVDPTQVAVADMGVNDLEVARHASVQLDSAPETGGQAELVSLWQMGFLGVKAVRFIDWLIAPGRQAAACSVVTGIQI